MKPTPNATAFLENMKREVRGAWIRHFMSFGATEADAEGWCDSLDSEPGKWDQYIEGLRKIERDDLIEALRRVSNETPSDR